MKLPLTAQSAGLATLQMRMRAVVVAGLLTRHVCAPSLAVLLAMKAHVLPPFRDISIDTLPERLLEVHWMVGRLLIFQDSPPTGVTSVIDVTAVTVNDRIAGERS